MFAWAGSASRCVVDPRVIETGTRTGQNTRLHRKIGAVWCSDGAEISAAMCTGVRCVCLYVSLTVPKIDRDRKLGRACLKEKPAFGG